MHKSTIFHYLAMLRFTDFSKNSFEPFLHLPYVAVHLKPCSCEPKNILYNSNNSIFRKNSIKIQKNANISKISEETYLKNHTIVISIQLATPMQKMKETIFF